MPITLGGERVGIHPPDNQSLTHVAYGCWDAYISMQFVRAEAIQLWERAESLHHRIDENPSHPSTAKAKERIEQLEAKILTLQSQFLTHDQSADAYWKMMTVRERERDAFHEMYGVEPDTPSILGNWHRDLGGREGAPKMFRMNPVALQFAPPHVAAAYIKGVR